MPTERLSMRKVREVLRLSWGGKLSTRAVAHSCGMGRTTVREYLPACCDDGFVVAAARGAVGQ